MNTPSVAPRIAQLYRESLKTWDEARSDELASLLHALRPARFASLELRLESWQSWSGPDTMKVLEREFGDPKGRSLLLLATMDRSGYVREAALRLLERAPASDAFPFVVQRTTDWVPAVREVAARTLELLCARLTDAELIQALELALQLRDTKSQRALANHGPLWIRFGQLSDAALLEGALTQGPATAARCLRVLAERRSPLLAQAIDSSLRSTHTALALAAVRELEHAPADSMHRLGALALRSRHPAVRQATLELLGADRLPREKVEAALRDSSPAVAGLALGAMRKLNPAFNAQAYYQAFVASPRSGERVVALAALARIGDPNDAAEAVMHLDDESAPVRRAALACLARLAPQEAGEAARAALDDSSRKVVLLAVRLAAHHKIPGLEPAAQRLLGSPDLQRRRIGLRLLTACALQPRLDMLASLLADPDLGSVALVALEKLLRTLLTGGVVLEPALTQRIVSAVERAPTQEDRWGTLGTRKGSILFALRTQRRG